MHDSLKKINRFNRMILLLSAFFWSSHAICAGSGSHGFSITQEDRLQVVVTLKPLYSLVAHLTADISAPQLLIRQLPSGHHYNLRPSQRKQLADADIIIWFGPQMESYLSKIITAKTDEDQPDTRVISAMQSPGLTLLSMRNHEAAAEHSRHHGRQMIDPHIWLSSRNMVAISEHIARALIATDPQNSDAYRSNLVSLIDLIERTDKNVRNTLESIPSYTERPFIAFHDAFQYFEEEYTLNHIATVQYEEGAGPGLKHLRDILSQIESHDISCLVYQRPRPALIEALVDQSAIRAVELDPVGAVIHDDENAWFELMQNLASGFARCLR